MPVPFCVNPPVPEITPPNSERFVPPTASVPAPNTTCPLMALILENSCVLPLRSRIELPPCRIRELPEAKEPLVPSFNVPPVTLTSPVKVLAAPIVVNPLLRFNKPAWKAGKLLSPAKSAMTALISPWEVTVCAARISAPPTRLIVPAVSSAPTRMLVLTSNTVLVWTSRKMDRSSAVELSIVN